MHCHKTGLCAQCAHPETRSHAHYACSAQVVGAVVCTTSWSAHVARIANAGSTLAGRALVVLIAPRPWAQVATSFPCPAPDQVATPKPGRDPPGDYPMSRHQSHVATSFLPTVGFPSHDTKNPGHDLPHCHLCRELKNDVATSNKLSPISTTPRRHFSMSRPPLLPPMSRPQS